MYEKQSAIRLAVYSVAGVACGVLTLVGVISPEQSDSILAAVGPAVGVLVAMLAAFNVNKSEAPANPVADVVDDVRSAVENTVGAFQKRG